MKLAEVLITMRDGEEIKLPISGSNWSFIFKENKLVFHANDEVEIDISKVKKAEYVFKNNNQGIIGGTELL